jgi:hypothetical protein
LYWSGIKVRSCVFEAKKQSCIGTAFSLGIPATDAYGPFRDDRKGLLHLTFSQANGIGNDLGLLIGVDASQSDQNDPRRNAALSKNQLAEILVAGDQYRLILIGELQDHVIGCPRKSFGDVVDPVALLSKSIYNLPIDTFVSEKSHKGSSVG